MTRDVEDPPETVTCNDCGATAYLWDHGESEHGEAESAAYYACPECGSAAGQEYEGGSWGGLSWRDQGVEINRELLDDAGIEWRGGVAP